VSAGTAGLLLEGVSKTFPGGAQAVREASLAVAAGELLVLVGPSGCGKTTLLRLVAGLEAPDAGRIVLAGRDLAGVGPARRDVGLVFQSQALYPGKTVYENLAFPLRVRGTPAREIDALVRGTAARLDLETVLQARPGQLSGGQQQRVALGRALVRRPALFLFDEPLSNLDPHLRRDLRQLIRRLQRELGRPAIHVTHDQEEALALADRLVVMSAGRLLQAGTPQEVYRRPVCRFVAGFLGSPPMNLVEGTLHRHEGRLHFASGNNLDLTLEDEQAERLQTRAGQGIVLGVRPAALSLAPRSAEALSLIGRVVLLEHLGDRVDVAVQVGAVRLTARLEEGQGAREGEEVRLFFAPGACHWFEPGAEGRAITA
jgi:ABC-type sugar transport system ATPase subunit